MYDNRVRSISFGPCSYLRRAIDILCCLSKSVRQEPIREPWSAAGQGAIKSKIVTYETIGYKFLTDNLLELLASEEIFNATDPKIGGTLPWQQLSNLIFVETSEKDCANKELKSHIKDEKSGSKYPSGNDMERRKRRGSDHSCNKLVQSTDCR